MNCPDADAIVTIGEALDWKVAGGLQHLQTCDECRERIDVLEHTRAALTQAELLDEATVQHISATLAQAARDEQARAYGRQRWLGVAESVAAGMTALLLLRSSGIRIESAAGAVVAFLLGAIAIVVGKILARRIPLLGLADAAHQ